MKRSGDFVHTVDTVDQREGGKKISRKLISGNNRNA